MFAKTTKDTPPLAIEPLAQTAPVPPAPAQPVQPPRPKPASMLVQGVAIKGDVMGDGELHLDCALQGDVRVGKLVLGPHARVEGSVHAQVVEIHGKVVGQVLAKQVRLYATAVVEGDITHEQLAMETGAQFQGRSLRLQRAAPPPAQTQAPAQAQAPAPVAPAAGHTPAVAVYPG